jgi:hypothetical protein
MPAPPGLALNSSAVMSCVAYTFIAAISPVPVPAPKFTAAVLLSWIAAVMSDSRRGWLDGPPAREDSNLSELSEPIRLCQEISRF